MYTYTERKTAVLLYIKYNRKATITVRELGYPSIRMLRNWYYEYLEFGDLHKEHLKKPNKYSIEERKYAVDYYIEHGLILAETVRSLGYPHIETLRKWITEFYPNHHRETTNRINPKNFTDKEKQIAVIALCSRKESADKISKKVGVSRHQLYVWKDHLLGKGVDHHIMKDQNPNGKELVEEIKSLKEEVHKLRLEQDILIKANELLKKDMGINLQDLSNKEKTVVIDALLHDYKLTDLITQLNIPRSSYFYQKKQQNCPDKYLELRKRVIKIFESNRQCYGYRRIHLYLKNAEMRVSEKVIRRIMHEESLVVKSRKQKRYNSYEGEISPSVENLIKRNFRADKPNEKWLTDITEFHIPTGKAYLSPIIDCYDGMVVSWSISTSPNANLVNSSLEAAIKVLDVEEHPIVHSDRGGHYRWPGWISRMSDAGLKRSMSKKGCSPDNAACEGFFGRLKNEMFYNRNWNNVNLEEFIHELNKYIQWYNCKRIKVSLGGLSPLDYRQKGLIF